jgi:ribosomal protein S18 acetylase RimI-like enzyme
MTRTLKHIAPKIPPGPACVVRLARLAEDVESKEVARLLTAYAHEALGGEALDPQTATRAIELVAGSADAFVLLASVGTTNVGLAICLPSISTFAAAGVVNVHDLWVDREFRARGLGSELLRCVRREAEQRGCAKVTLEVREDNPGARRLYRRRGFRGEPGTPNVPGTFFLELTL